MTNEKEAPQWILTKPLVDDNWGNHTHELTGHKNDIFSVAFSHDSTRVDCAVFSIAFSHDSSLLASTAGSAVLIWDLETGERVQKFQGRNPPIHSLRFLHDSTQITSACSQYAKTWDLTTKKCVGAFEADPGFKLHAVSQDSTLVASVGNLGVTLKVQNTTTYECIQTFDITRNLGR